MMRSDTSAGRRPKEAATCAATPQFNQVKVGYDELNFVCVPHSPVCSISGTFSVIATSPHLSQNATGYTEVHLVTLEREPPLRSLSTGPGSVCQDE